MTKAPRTATILNAIALAAVLTAAPVPAAADTAATIAETPAQLPGIGNDGLTLPLTVDQLDPSEQKNFAALPAGSVDARQFSTRGDTCAIASKS